MKIDWQMYEDGLLEPEQIRKAEEALASDEGARKELEGLREFRKMVRKSAMRERVPHGRLREILRTVAGRDRRPAWRLFGALAATTAVAAVLVIFAFGLLPSADTTEVYRSFKSPQAAQSWASHRSGMNLPTIELASLGRMKGVHSTVGWACYDFDVDGWLVHVYVRAGPVVEGCDLVIRDGRTYYLPPGSNTVCFSQRGMTFTVDCGDEDLRWRVAKQAAQEVEVVF
ncbi:MAG: hypothetical protein IH945_11425 [Armatimonadetes bacterium]|nr:hypothetical protein [Armatimonadota bacterium]